MSLRIQLTLLAGLLAITACSDAPTAPSQQPSIDRVAVQHVMSGVMDARVRIAPSLDDAAIRERVTYDLQELEFALNVGDGAKARLHVRVIGSVLKDYAAQLANHADRADVSAITLVLNSVSQVVDAGYDISSP